MIYIIRHGQTAKNKANVLQGRSNTPLNEAGKLQAAEIRAWFEEQGVFFDKVYTSPLVRAKETAAIIAEGVPQTVDERLIEMDYGPYEGTDLKDPAPEIITFFSDFANNPAPEGMEPLPDIVSRLKCFLEDIKDEAAEKNILISTHAIAMKGALEHLTPGSKGSYWSKYIGNCAVYKTEVRPDGTFSIPYECVTKEK